MKRIVSLLLLVLVFACSEKNENEEEITKSYEDDTFTISLKTSEDLKHQYLLSESFPTEGGYVITKEPEYAAFSKIEYKQEGIFYVYQPEQGFTGTDEVEITNNISAGGPEPVAQTILELQIEVAE